jgi:hypothetical protein
MTTQQPTYRRPLNPHQHLVLQQLYTFRFATDELLATSTKNVTRRFVHERLRILVEQEYIGKRYDSSYKLLGKPATYHLLEKGIAVLAEDPKRFSKQILRRIKKDDLASDRFVRHCLSIYRAAMQLKRMHGNDLKFFTASGLNAFDYFPKPLPDGFASKNNEYYMIECFDNTMPESVMRQKITKYVDHFDGGDWTPDSPYPTVLLICRDERLRNKVEKWVTKSLDEGWSNELDIKTLLTSR